MELNDMNDSETVVDMRLFKVIGLYQLLCPAVSVATSGHRTALMTGSIIMTGTFVVQTAALYLAIDDFSRLAYMVMMITVGFTSLFKGYLLIRQANPMWRVLELARYAFTASARRDPSELLWCRDTMSTVLRTFTIVNYVAVAAWLISPIFIHERVPVTNIDGTVAMYRTSVFNMWTPLSENAYNTPFVFAAVYAFESFICSYCVFIFNIFDSYLITVCLVLVANFRTIATRYQSLGQSGNVYSQIFIYFVLPSPG